MDHVTKKVTTAVVITALVAALGFSLFINRGMVDRYLSSQTQKIYNQCRGDALSQLIVKLRKDGNMKVELKNRVVEIGITNIEKKTTTTPKNEKSN